MGISLVKSQCANNYYGFRPNWYAEISSPTGRKHFSLNVKVEGNPVTKDSDFLASRERAQTAFNKIKEARKVDRLAINEIQNLIKVKTGKGIEDIPLKELSERYLTYGANANLSYTHKASLKSAFSLFEIFAKKQGVTTLLEVTKALAVDFVAFEGKRLSNNTINKHITALKKAFNIFLPNGVNNPFENAKSLAIGKRRDDTIHHLPLNTSEIKRLLKLAKDTPYYGLVITAVATGMRISDITNLKWDSVNLVEGVITVKTRKTGAIVAIPLIDDHAVLGAFKPWLENAKAHSKGVYVFPDFQKMNVKKIYAIGKRLIGKAVLSPTMATRRNGRKTAIYSWHSLRSSFVTIMSEYMPLDIIQSLVGHATTETTMEYLHPTHLQATKKAKECLEGKKEVKANDLAVMFERLNDDEKKAFLAMIK